MIIEERTTERGFEFVLFHDSKGSSCSIQQSSAIGDFPDAVKHPGTSFLWIGRDGSDRMHISREQVPQIIEILQRWARTGALHSTG